MLSALTNGLNAPGGHTNDSHTPSHDTPVNAPSHPLSHTLSYTPTYILSSNHSLIPSHTLSHLLTHWTSVGGISEATSTTMTDDNNYNSNSNNSSSNQSSTSMTHLEMVRAALKDGNNNNNNNNNSTLDNTGSTLNPPDLHSRSASNSKLNDLAMAMDVDAAALALSAMAGEFRPVHVPSAPGLAQGQGLGQAPGQGLGAINTGLSPMNQMQQQQQLQSNLPDYLQPQGNNNLNNNSHHDQLLLSSLLSGSTQLGSGLNISPTGSSPQSLTLNSDGRFSTSSHNLTSGNTSNNLHGNIGHMGNNSSTLDGLTSLLQGLNNGLNSGLNSGLNNNLNQHSLLGNNINNNQTNNNFNLASLRQSLGGSVAGTFGGGVNDGVSPAHGAHNMYHTNDVSSGNNALSMGLGNIPHPL